MVTKAHTPAKKCSNQLVNSYGYTLVELVIVLLIVGVMSALSLTMFSGQRDVAGAGERVLTDSMRCLQERRGAALRLNAIEAPTSLESYTAPPVEIDFLNPATTASLITDGVDADGNNVDDYTGKSITHLSPPREGSVGKWSYSYLDNPLALPTGWKVVRSEDDLRGIPLIGKGTYGRGRIATHIAFNAYGQAMVMSGDGTWLKLPEGSDDQSGRVEDTPFWSVYFVADAGGHDTAAVAIAVHPTGQLEEWRWDGSRWQGFKRRSLF